MNALQLLKRFSEATRSGRPHKYIEDRVSSPAVTLRRVILSETGPIIDGVNLIRPTVIRRD